jgi:hypothetical protein
LAGRTPRTLLVSQVPGCASGPGAPLEVASVQTALAAEGLATETDRDLCRRPAVALLTNPDPRDGYGSLFCEIHDRPRTPLAKELRLAQDDELRGGFTFTLANTVCSIYPRGGDLDAQVEQLNAAFERLEASL